MESRGGSILDGRGGSGMVASVCVSLYLLSVNSTVLSRSIFCKHHACLSYSEYTLQ